MKSYLHLDKLILTILFILLTSSQISYAGGKFTKISYAGVELPDNAMEWSCVKHNVTGQIWEVKTIENKDIPYTFDEASNYSTQVNNQVLCGFIDWRVPTIKELGSITDKTKYDPAINTIFFPNTRASHYWSSIPHANSSATSNGNIFRWLNFFINGMSVNNRHGYGYVRLVHGDQYFDFFNYTKLDSSGNDLLDEAANWSCVRDNRNGLIWEVKTTENKDSTYTFDETSNYIADINNSNLCGYNDWRVPSFDELISIVDYSSYNAAINTTYFPNTSSSSYRSIILLPDNSNDTWYIHFYDGFTGDLYNQNSSINIRLVRSSKFFTSLPSMLFLLF